MKHVEMIIDYVTDGTDFEYCDNHGVLTRCRDCKHYAFADNRAFGFPVKRCEWTGFEDVDADDFCSRAERREDSNESKERP